MSKQSPTNPRGSRKTWRDVVRFGQFRRSEDGAVAVEFSIVIFPFLLFVAMIFELTINYYAQQTLHEAVYKVARKVKTKQITSSPNYGEAEFRAELCAETLLTLMKFKCNELIIDVQQVASFTDLGTPRNQDGTVNSAGMGFAPGGATTVNVLRVYYEWPIYVGFIALGNADHVSKGSRTLTASQAFMIEP